MKKPSYHFTPPQGWMNDPNGFIYHNGLYHLFYQHNPKGTTWDRVCWGHAVSSDLLDWQHWPLALTPSVKGFDQFGCWSGCAIINNGIPTIIYTAARDFDASDHRSHSSIMLARSFDGWRTWHKRPVPIVVQPAGRQWQGHDLLGFRDPFVWKDGKSWLMIVGTGLRDAVFGGNALLYTSIDLINWQCLGLVAEGEPPLWTGTLWECPQLLFWPPGRATTMLLGTWQLDGPENQALYLAGAWQDQRFLLQQAAVFDAGCLFATQACQDAAGRTVAIGWLREERAQLPTGEGAWAGTMSLPRVLTHCSDGTLWQTPLPALTAWRGERFVSIGCLAGSQKLDFAGDCLELKLRWRNHNADQLLLWLWVGADERTALVFEPHTGCLRLDRSQSSLASDVSRLARTLTLPANGEIELHVFLDHTTLEIFVAGQALSARIYPSELALGLEIETRGGEAEFMLEGWLLAKPAVALFQPIANKTR
jgi:beta-fructofuranosidase